ncbi:MAG: sialate O-acetylesterase, partial [Mediterranea sp.]|nr:sialate O-acetylesterase [Mediterranea sp.]
MKNRTFRNKTLGAALLLAACLPLRAEVKLPAIFADGMVMQQQTNANLWGTATPGKQVTVVTGWDNKQHTASADKNGNWHLSVATPVAGGPYTLTFSDGTKKTLTNILIGELWLCSGQSNMEMPMKGYKNQPVAHATMDILRSANPQMRLFTVKRTSTFEPQADVVGTWSEATPESVRGFSATAYYFGRLVNEVLKVPVGLVVTSWGGSACEAWMRADWLKAFPDAKLPHSQADIKSPNRTPTALYNGMLHPLIGLTMRGVIWYQGEDNCNRAHTYADMFATLIKGWRSVWGEGDFPFYYCQIAPYDYSLITAKGEPVVNSAYLREAQAKVELRVPNTGMAVLLDAGLREGIHPLK